MRVFEIRYNDGILAEEIRFDMSKIGDIGVEEFLQKEVKEFNNNPNKSYRITRGNIQEV